MQQTRSDFNVLIQSGNIGFYQSCEVTQLFIYKKSDNTISNFFILISFEEKPYQKLNHKFLNEKPLKINKSYTLGIQRYHFSIPEVMAAFDELNDNGKWNFNENNSLLLGKLKSLTKQFVPAKEGQRLNHVLKNNFKNGSYLIEFFDESKGHVDFILDIKKIKLFNQLSEEIKNIANIDLSVVRDRVGNIVFQFPIDILYTSSKSLPTWDGVQLKFIWHQRILSKPDCFIQVESKIDKNYMGGTIEEYNGEDTQTIIIGNLDQINHIKIWQKSPSLLLSTFDGTYLREFVLNSHITSHEPRIFEINNQIEKISVSSQGMTSGAKNEIKYTTYITGNLYDAEKSHLEKTLSFKQYFNGTTELALQDIRKLINSNDSNGVYLWDPYLRATDIFKTLYYSPTHGVELKAIGSVDKATNTVYETKGQSPESIIASEITKFENPKNNNYGLNFEFRMQYGSNGWAFHDRFLIFPGNKSTRPKAYSLGTSINSLGKSHHILQEVSHPQRVIDAFLQLWDKLNNDKCLVWKFPVK